MYVFVSPIERRSGVWSILHGINDTSPWIDGDLSTPDQIVFGGTSLFRASQIPVGGYVVLYSNQNRGLALTIGEVYTNENNRVTRIDVQGNWSVESTKSYFITNFTDRMGFWTQGGRTYDISKYVESVSYETNVDGGFTVATVQMSETKSDILRVFSRASGYLIRIFLNSGHKAWEGIVTSTNINGYGGSIEARGFAATNEWFFANGEYPGDNREISNTWNIITEQLQHNPYISKTEYGPIDRGYAGEDAGFGGLHHAQMTSSHFRGWGPLNFDETPTTVKEAIEMITRYGNHPLVREGDLAPDDMYFQVYFDQIATTKTIPRGPTEYREDPPWYLDESNFEFGYAGVEIQSSFEDIKNVRRMTYTDVDGETVNTQSAMRWPHILWQGPTEEVISSATLTGGEAALVLMHPLKELPVMSKPGSIRVSGVAKRGNGAFKQPVSLIRAGDIVMIQIKNTDVYPYANENSLGPRFVVGSTRYDSESDSIEISVFTKSSLVERTIAILDAPGV